MAVAVGALRRVLRLTGGDGDLHRRVRQVVGVAHGLLVQVDDVQLLLLGVGDVGLVAGHLDRRARLLPVLLLLPGLDDLDRGRLRPLLLVDDAQAAVVGEHEPLTLGAARERAEPVRRAEVDELEAVVAGVDQRDPRRSLLLGVLVDLVVPEHDRRSVGSGEVARAGIGVLDRHLVEGAVTEDDGAVLAPEDHDVAVGVGLGRGLAVDSRAVLGLAEDRRALLVLDRRARVLGALRGEQRPVGQLHGDTVMCRVGAVARRAAAGVGDLVRIHREDRPVAVGEQHGPAVMQDDMSGVGHVVGDRGQAGCGSPGSWRASGYAASGTDAAVDCS
ncbi:hypothetical protein [Mobilicoccus caccae]|uniref:hypothetical protein n=1 Tax=Mobilicoccus caccae TaxID=1859295 RepID=UPI0024E09313|nr:hypothetical protein [Mobilicoccus caccae]